ncbi:FkbM family methyltransferase [Streptomyces fractus]|uniref:FkbM family methyltransferase n=1 Tax=Streptomyces fractus TaxID=641806 RepID=UPI003CF6F9CA
MPLAVQLPRNPDVLSRNGVYAQALNVLSRKETAVQRQLRRAGLAGYEPLTQATLMALAQRAPVGSSFYDVGAHIGLYSALVNAVYKDRRLTSFAFEPTPATARICREIRDRNHLSYKVVQCAVSDKSGEAELYLSDKAESSNSLNPAHRKSSGSTTVPVVTLDGFTQTERATPHLIKIDVETLEADVLRGALGTIEQYRPWIVVELLPSSEPSSLREVLARLAVMGYRFHVIQAEKPWHAWNETTYRPHVGSHCRDWLLAPEPLDDAFHRMVRRWLIAILACDEDTNLTVPGGTPFPEGWNAPYVRADRHAGQSVPVG